MGLHFYRRRNSGTAVGKEEEGMKSSPRKIYTGRCITCKRELWTIDGELIPARKDPDHVCRVNIASVPGVKRRDGVETP